MKKKLGIAIGTVTAAAVIGMGVYHSDAAQANPTLSSEEISDLIQNQYPGTVSELEVDKKGDKAVYEVEIQSDGVEYELKLDGDTGEVLNEKHKETNASKKNESEGTAEQDKSLENLIGDQQAREIALKEFDGTIKEFELDEDDGRFVYELEIINGDKEAEFEIDALTGEILEMEIDTEDD
ncbi:PepSY domain-containing protein [Oceanobacillus polygoni]|uniref:Membrane protein YkoI n=1 Tax=Oceanobacillus polygoni TaxID=1235259 RepID=A0A9X0Z2N9_9BACI|nr:PepSY domain-containing protein [Oceanobacillus polygoni]MBP2079831.1 putative membrane protein YkoI [Oceanobacillus polygoni]